MPNKPKTPHRTIRVPDDEWQSAQTRAEEEGVTVSDVVRQALRAYVVGKDSRRSADLLREVRALRAQLKNDKRSLPGKGL